MYRIENLSPEELNAIQQLKNRVENGSTSSDFIDDAMYYRFLNARNFNVDTAEKLLRKHIHWRKLYQIDKIVENFKPLEVFVKYIEPSLVGFDKEGDVIRYFKCGTLNNTEIMKCVKMNDYMKNWIWFAEKNMSLIKQQTKKTGKLTTVSFIVDLDNLEFTNATSRITPSYYVFIYTIIKNVVSHVMIRKVQIFGHSGFKEKLLEVIDADVLPAFLGGKRTDPDGDPYCRSFITIPEKIPESYYLSEEDRYFKDMADVSALVIRPQEKKELFVQVKESGSSIRWKFMVQRKSIGFGLFFDDKQKPKEIIPLHEYDTSDGTEENSYICSSIGKYIIIFDNSCSRFTTKEVKYVISVEKPEDLTPNVADTIAIS